MATMEIHAMILMALVVFLALKYRQANKKFSVLSLKFLVYSFEAYNF
jgi:hypothetical protein